MTSFLWGRFEIRNRFGLEHPAGTIMPLGAWMTLVKSNQSSETDLCSAVLTLSFKQAFKHHHPTVTPSPTWSLSPRWFTKAPIINVAGSGVRRFSNTPPMMQRLLIIPGNRQKCAMVQISHLWWYSFSTCAHDCRSLTDGTYRFIA